MTTLTDAPTPAPSTPDPERRPGELGPVELARWTWRQLTSMRTALVLLLLLALAAVPGSIVPQEAQDSVAVQRWREDHPTLAPVYDRLGLFSVYESAWFSAIYILLMISLVGCIIPRMRVYARALRTPPPAAPSNLGRLPDHASYRTDEDPEVVLARARELLRGRRFRVVRRDARGGGPSDAVSAERGKLREAGNLLFHLSIVLVLVGFAMGRLLGYQGGVIVVAGQGFANNVTQYDDFVPGALFDVDRMEPFSFDITDFDVEWIEEGRGQGMARGFVADLAYQEAPGAETQTYELKVNDPLKIGETQLFLIGHGYAPVITVRDGNGDVAYSGPTVFLPEDPSFRSFGVVKAPDARPQQIGLEGLFFPTFVSIDGDPVSVIGDDRNPTISMLAYVGDLGLDDGQAQSVYALDKDEVDVVTEADGSMFRVDLQPGQTLDLPDGAGSVTFDGVQEWNRLQVSQTPGKFLALGGVVLALLGMMGSLFIRPRRFWVRARRDGDGTLVEVAGLDRSGGGDVAAELDEVVTALRGEPAHSKGEQS